jgi:HNH endonuclease
VPPFKDGTKLAYPHGRTRRDGKLRPTKYLRITAGPQRGKYVHDLIAEARLGRELEGDETVEHKDGNGLNVAPGNLVVVTKTVNTQLRHSREQKARAAAAGQGEMRWEGTIDEPAPF